jgi:hypothetical protein
MESSEEPLFAQNPSVTGLSRGMKKTPVGAFLQGFL